MSRTSRAFRTCFAGRTNRIVCMLCSRSASFVATTLVSADSTADTARVTLCPHLRRLLSRAMVPATIAAISGPNSRLSAMSVYGVSSTVSCNIAAHSVLSSAPSPARIVATVTGWVMYGSPLYRNWPRWQCAEMS